MVIFASIFMALMGFGLIAMSLGSLIDISREKKKILDAQANARKVFKERYTQPYDTESAHGSITDRLGIAAAEANEIKLLDSKVSTDHEDKADKILTQALGFYKQHKAIENPEWKGEYEHENFADIHKEKYGKQSFLNNSLSLESLVKESENIVNKVSSIKPKEFLVYDSVQTVIPSKAILDEIYNIELVKYTAESMRDGIKKNPVLFTVSALEKDENPEEYVQKLEKIVEDMDKCFKTLTLRYTDFILDLSAKLEHVESLLGIGDKGKNKDYIVSP